jgi:hypothetical protein
MKIFYYTLFAYSSWYSSILAILWFYISLISLLSIESEKLRFEFDMVFSIKE